MTGDPKGEIRIRKRSAAAVAAAMVAAAAGGMFFVCSGRYSVAASKPDNPFIRWVLRTTMERSVRRHARLLDLPNFLNRGRSDVGFRHYDEMCVECHGAPGIRPELLGDGLNPRPPELAKAAKEWSIPEIYWITRHGIRMSGMASFEGSHDDVELWALAAFVKRLPEISAAEYQRMRLRERETDGPPVSR